MTDLGEVAHGLCSPGKGILAADESVKSADKRLESYGIKTSREIRRQYRDLFLEAPGAADYLSGVILHEETLDECTDMTCAVGERFPDLLHTLGIKPGIKVDLGTEPFPESSNELITNGLIGLPERLAAFREKYRTEFTKWRMVVRIDGDKLPSENALVENAKRLAQYACEVQKAGMVPILEPEVLLEGTHSRMRAKEVLVQTLSTVIDAVSAQPVDLSAIIIKTAMAVSGDKNGRTDTPEEVAEDTVDALMSVIPAEVPGIVFLSGGQTPDQATDNLRAIARLAKERGAPWPLTFSYARALQDEALTIWQGKEENVEAARTAFITRLKAVFAAAKGE